MPILRDPISVNIKPVWNKNSKILFIGSITAKDGIEKGFYYSSSRNQLWELLDFVLQYKRTKTPFSAMQSSYKATKSKSGFPFSELKQKLMDNSRDYKNAKIKKSVFEKERTRIQKEIKSQLLKSNIAVCDIFEKCHFKNDTSFDSDIILNDKYGKGYLPTYYKSEIEKIIEYSNIELIVVNSNFVNKQFSGLGFDYLLKSKGISVVKVCSPSPASRIKLENKFNDWVSKIWFERVK